MSKYQNVIGPVCHRLRNKKKWTQEQAAAKCTIAGFRVSRSVYANIESQERKVSDYELILLARAFRVTPAELLPSRLPKWTKNIITGHCKD